MKNRTSWSQLSALHAVEEPLEKECIWMSACERGARVKGGGGYEGGVGVRRLDFRVVYACRFWQTRAPGWATHREVSTADLGDEEAVRRVPGAERARCEARSVCQHVHHRTECRRARRHPQTKRSFSVSPLPPPKLEATRRSFLGHFTATRHLPLRRSIDSCDAPVGAERGRGVG